MMSSIICISFTVGFDFTKPLNEGRIVKNEITAHRVKKELYEKGIIVVKTPSGNEVNAYCIEHTLCDILQVKYAIDIQVVTDAFKRYSKYKNKNLPLLSEFAKMSRVEEKVRNYLEVLI